MLANRAKAGQVAGNFNTLIMLRVKELATAEMLTEQLPKVEVFTLMSVSGVDDSSEPGSGVDFKSRNEDRISVSEVPLLTPAELVTLPKGPGLCTAGRWPSLEDTHAIANNGYRYARESLRYS